MCNRWRSSSNSETARECYCCYPCYNRKAPDHNTDEPGHLLKRMTWIGGGFSSAHQSCSKGRSWCTKEKQVTQLVSWCWLLLSLTTWPTWTDGASLCVFMINMFPRTNASHCSINKEFVELSVCWFVLIHLPCFCSPVFHMDDILESSFWPSYVETGHLQFPFLFF